MTDQNHPGHDERSTTDAWEDRLIDQAMREVLGDERPPDLSEKILAAAEESPRIQTQHEERVMGESKGSKRRWLTGVAAAACVAVGVGIGLAVPSIWNDRQTARNGQCTTSQKEIDLSDRVIATPEQPAEEAVQETSPRVAEGRPPLSGKDDNSPDTSLASVALLKGLLRGDATGERKRVYPVADLVMPITAGSSIGSGDGMLTTNGGMGGMGGGMGGMSGAKHRSWNGNKDITELDRFTYFATTVCDADTPTDITSHVNRLFDAGSAEGQGPGQGGDQYTRVVDNPFRQVTDHPLSTFSIDVDTASYANVRRFLLTEQRLPPPDAVRIEELVNYFDYEYAGPTDDVPFASHIEVAQCPWQPEHRLVRVGLKGKEIARKARPKSNLVFLLDVSGSMSSQDKLPLLKEGMKLLAGKLSENDRVAIVVYASSEGLVLPSTSGDQQETIQEALGRLESGGSTNGGAGIELAYKLARENFIEEGVNRVLLCTDGDFNVGTTSPADLERMVEEQAKSGVFLSVLGFGRGNLNDAMMENISNKGNGNYAYIDGIREARKVLIEQMSGTLVTIAKDVKIQIEFNPTQVAAYRLIGYENRILAAEDFNDDKKDAGEIGAGHTVTALYELVPVDAKVEGDSRETPSVDPLKYQKPTEPFEPKKLDKSTAAELLTLKLRYKKPDGDKSTLLEFPVTDDGKGFAQASGEMKFASAVASFGMLLRKSEHGGNATWDAVLEIATEAKGADEKGYRTEFLDMVRAAKEHSAE